MNLIRIFKNKKLVCAMYQTKLDITVTPVEGGYEVQWGLNPGGVFCHGFCIHNERGQQVYSVGETFPEPERPEGAEL